MAAAAVLPVDESLASSFLSFSSDDDDDVPRCSMLSISSISSASPKTTSGPVAIASDVDLSSTMSNRKGGAVRGGSVTASIEPSFSSDASPGAGEGGDSSAWI